MKLNTLMPAQKWMLFNQPGEEGSGGDPAPSPDPAPSGDPDPTSDPAPAADYSFLPDDYRGEDGAYDLDKFKADYGELADFKKSQDERLAGIPEEYDFAIPEDVDYGDLDLPEGFEIIPFTDEPAFKPLFDELGAFLKDNQISGDGAGKVMGLISKYEATKYAQGMAAMKGEIESLTNGKERIKDLSRRIETKLPEAEADALKASLSTADGVRALEKIMGGKSFSAPNSEPSEKKTDPLTARYPTSASK